MTINIKLKDLLYFREKNMGKTKQMPTNKQLAFKTKHMTKPSKQPTKPRAQLTQVELNHKGWDWLAKIVVDDVTITARKARQVTDAARKAAGGFTKKCEDTDKVQKP